MKEKGYYPGNLKGIYEDGTKTVCGKFKKNEVLLKRQLRKYF